MNATPSSDWVQQLLALQYSSAFYASLMAAANASPQGADPNAVALAQQTAVSNWFTNGAAATSVPASDTPAGAYYSNGAAATSMSTDASRSAWYTNGASVTSVPTGDARGASYFANGAQATSVPPAPSASQSVIPPTAPSAMPPVNAAGDGGDGSGVAPNEAPTEAPSAPPATEPVDTSTTTTNGTVAAGQEAFALNDVQATEDASVASATIANPSVGTPNSQAGGGTNGTPNATPPTSQRIALYETQSSPSSADAVRSPMMGVRVLIAVFGVAVMAWLVIGKLVARRARTRDAARSVV